MKTDRRTGLNSKMLALLLVVFLGVCGCAGIKPYEPRDYREEGMEKGLFSGSEGEFVIIRKDGESETGSEASERSDETSDQQQQNRGSEEKAGF